MQSFDPRSIAVVTGTCYPSWEFDSDATASLRGNLSLRMIDAAREKGYRVVVGDVGSSREFLGALRLRNIVSQTRPGQGMSNARQQTFIEASMLPGVKAIVWTEEKISLIQHCLPMAAQPILDGAADVVIPSRDEASLASYPPFQAEIERRCNASWNRLLRRAELRSWDEPELDNWFGPRIFANTLEMLAIFTAQHSFDGEGLSPNQLINPGLYADAMTFPVMRALAEGHRVHSVSVPYRNSPEQTGAETNSPEMQKKRKMQRIQILGASLYFARLLAGHADSRLKLIS